MKRLLVVIISSLFLLTACQKAEQDKAVDTDELADKIAQTDAFDDSISKVEDDVATVLLNLDSSKISDISCYMNTGATPEMVVVLKADADYKQSAIDALNTYTSSEKENFEGYSPEQVVKIDNMNLDEVSDVVVLCVSNNSDKISDVIKSYNK
ncbi:MAG: DUF4358 domain-containing protein [Oscillospiraceae bacterium]